MGNGIEITRSRGKCKHNSTVFFHAQEIMESQNGWWPRDLYFNALRLRPFCVFALKNYADARGHTGWLPVKSCQ